MKKTKQNKKNTESWRNKLRRNYEEKRNLKILPLPKRIRKKTKTKTQIWEKKQRWPQVKSKAALLKLTYPAAAAPSITHKTKAT